jgi:hypothetical protein
LFTPAGRAAPQRVRLDRPATTTDPSRRPTRHDSDRSAPRVNLPTPERGGFKASMQHVF